MELHREHWVLEEGLRVLLIENIGGAKHLYLGDYIRLIIRIHRDSAAVTLSFLRRDCSREHREWLQMVL